MPNPRRPCRRASGGVHRDGTTISRCVAPWRVAVGVELEREIVVAERWHVRQLELDAAGVGRRATVPRHVGRDALLGAQRQRPANLVHVQRRQRARRTRRSARLRCRTTRTGAIHWRCALRRSLRSAAVARSSVLASIPIAASRRSRVASVVTRCFARPSGRCTSGRCRAASARRRSDRAVGGDGGARTSRIVTADCG